MGSKNRRKSGVNTPESVKKKKQKVGVSNEEDLYEFLSSTLESVEELRVKHDQIAFDFLELPDKKLYSDYYTSIKHPISLKEIRKKIEGKNYDSVLKFVQDFKLMSDNANAYNEDGSVIAINSKRILEFVEKQVKSFNESFEEKTLPKIKFKTPTNNNNNNNNNSNTGFDLKKEFLAIIDELIDYEDNGVRIGDPFLEEVSRKDYPDYYKLIKQAMSLSTVKKNVNQNSVKSIDGFVKQVDTIWENAQRYNQEGSLIYDDSKTLHDFFHKRVDQLKKKEGQTKGNIKLKVKPPAKLKIHLNVKGDKVKQGEAGADAKAEDDEDEEKDEDEEAENDEEDEDEDGDEDEDENEDEDEDKGDEDEGQENKDEESDVVQEEEKTKKLSAADSTSTDAAGLNGEQEIEKKPERDQRKEYKTERFHPDDHLNELSLIQEISISSSRSVYRQATRAAALNSGQLPSVFQSWFEFRFGQSQQRSNYTLALPPQQSAVSVLAGLNDELLRTKHAALLSVNGERVSPTPSVQYADTRLASRYELKLAIGLNLVEFVLRIEPGGSAPREEKRTFWVLVS